jgi:WD40 repeat protein
MVHPLFATGTGGSLASEPMAILSGPGRSTPVYTVGQFLPGGSPELIATGWFDGKVRIYDLRSASQSGFETLEGVEPATSSAGPTPLNPVLTLSDPWRSFDPIYSLATRSEMSDPQANSQGGLPHQYHYLAAGSALHSVVCLWDVRRPSTGWSVYAPGGDNSPVYTLRAEGSRVWGATQWRAFVLDFGPEAKDTIWPRVDDVALDHLDNGPPTYLHFLERYENR